ncbi:hypothetical protein C9374_010553 [Naegleria lovaniensis]|uniref:Ubiquinone biosynthesis protein n=1 Tax=Naegleria lovaniensis TaxID=51637 RepID=A0AA88KFV2_NAELO|nr:uncharacterized protein C9374_010553 [Naegleria lovaniensis]KAG2374809.1 hypothetical protein C9374_010553 [Naegleria lovaniensis]
MLARKIVSSSATATWSSLLLKRSLGSGAGRLILSSSSFGKKNEQVCSRTYSTNNNIMFNAENNNNNYNIGSSSEASYQSVGSVQKLKNKILDTAIDKYVLSHGWTVESITQAAKDFGLSPMASSQLFATGSTSLGPETELIQYFLTKCNREMSTQIQLMDKTGMDIPTIIKKSIRLRLEMVAPFVRAGKWTEAMSTFIFGPNPLVDTPTQLFNQLTGFKTSGTTNALGPVNQVQGLNALYNAAILVDEICHIAGIRDTDIQWYIKRAGVGLVYTSCEFYMLTDNSPDFQDTWSFLDRRMDELTVLQSVNEGLTSAVGGIFGSVLSVISAAVAPQQASPVSTSPTTQTQHETMPSPNKN